MDRFNADYAAGVADRILSEIGKKKTKNVEFAFPLLEGIEIADLVAADLRGRGHESRAEGNESQSIVYCRPMMLADEPISVEVKT